MKNEKMGQNKMCREVSQIKRKGSRRFKKGGGRHREAEAEN